MGSSFPWSVKVSIISFCCYNNYTSSVAHHFYLYTQWVIKYFSYAQSCMYKKLTDLYACTSLAGLTINSIVQQSRHVLQCTQNEKFTLEEHVVCELENRKQKLKQLVFINRNLVSCPTPQKKKNTSEYPSYE